MLRGFQITMGFAWLIWFTTGTAGLESGLKVGSLLVLGLGAKNLLDTFWNKQEIAARTGKRVLEEPSLFSSRKKMNLPSPNWSLVASFRAGAHESPGTSE